MINFFLIFTVFVSIAILVFSIWTLYEFVRIDKEQFKYYILGVSFYGISVLYFLFRYIILPPLNDFENVFTGYGTYIAPLIGIFYFVKGTEHLAKEENSNFKKNQRVHALLFSFIIITSIVELFYVFLSVNTFSRSLYHVTTVLGYFFYTSVIFLSLKLLVEYQKAFGDILSKIIFQYVLAIIIFITGGLIIVFSFRPINIEGLTIEDISILRKLIATIGLFLVLIPFIICFKNVFKLRKHLTS